MFRTFQNSWELLGSSVHVLSRDKELLIFPVVSGIAMMIVLGSFGTGAWMFGWLDRAAFERLEDPEQSLFVAENLPVLAALFGFYFLNYLVITYFNSALIGAAYIRLNGGDPTVADGFAAANRVIGPIIGYSLIAATVGLILKALESKSENWIARIVIGLIGYAWSLIVFLVVPVLVIERAGPVTAIKRSASLLRNSWGEQIVANVGFGFISFLFALIGFAIIAGGAYLTFGLNAGVWVFVTACGIAVLYWLLLGVVMSALQGIYVAALYAYANDKPVDLISHDLLRNSFRPR